MYTFSTLTRSRFNTKFKFVYRQYESIYIFVNTDMPFWSDIVNNIPFYILNNVALYIYFN